MVKYLHKWPQLPSAGLIRVLYSSRRRTRMKNVRHETENQIHTQRVKQAEA